MWPPAALASPTRPSFHTSFRRAPPVTPRSTLARADRWSRQATAISVNSIPAAAHASLSPSLIGRDAFEISVSPLQNRWKPPPDPENPTVQLSLQRLSQGYYNDYSQVFAGTLLSVVPLLVIFIIFGRQIIGGLMEGAVKA